jgi:hypothetical protein
MTERRIKLETPSSFFASSLTSSQKSNKIRIDFDRIRSEIIQLRVAMDRHSDIDRINIEFHRNRIAINQNYH